MKMVILINPEFHRIFQRLQKQTLPLKTVRKIRKISKLLQEELEEFNKLRDDTLKQYCEKDEAGNPKKKIVNGKETNDFEFSEENMKLINDELTKLLEEDIVLEKINEADLGKDYTISANDAEVLDGIVAWEE